VNNGEDALAALKDHPVDLVFMDIQMPGIDGLETTRRIRSQQSDGKYVSIVALTAHAMKGDRDRCLEAGMDDYIAKPLHMRDLQRIIEHMPGHA
jgi:CheY-like chemotaxis protein